MGGSELRRFVGSTDGLAALDGALATRFNVYLAQLLADSGVPAQALTLEITETSVLHESDEVRRVLGIRTVVYHLAVPPGGSLTSHHALHAGTGLAHAHAAAARDFDALRAHAPGREPLVDEMQGASIAGLDRAQVALAQAISPSLTGLSLDPPTDPQEVRRTLLQHLRAPA